MPVKRSRIGRSSSFGDTGVLPRPAESAEGWRSAPPAAAASSRKRPSGNASLRASEKPAEASPRPRILTLASPVQESAGSTEKEPVGDFLGACYLCKKRINENAEVFMYSYLRAFCTVECRDMQIAIDNEIEKASGSFQGMQLSPTQ